MFIFANLIKAVAEIISIVLELYMWLIIANAVLSWVNPDPYNQIVQFLARVTEPVLDKVRKVFPFVYMGGLDLSPMVIILAILFLQRFLVTSLHQFAMGLR